MTCASAHFFSPQCTYDCQVSQLASLQFDNAARLATRRIPLKREFQSSSEQSSIGGTQKLFFGGKCRLSTIGYPPESDYGSESPPVSPLDCPDRMRKKGDPSIYTVPLSPFCGKGSQTGTRTPAARCWYIQTDPFLPTLFFLPFVSFFSSPPSLPKDMPLPPSCSWYVLIQDPFTPSGNPKKGKITKSLTQKNRTSPNESAKTKPGNFTNEMCNRQRNPYS